MSRFKSPRVKRLSPRTWAELQQEIASRRINRVFVKWIYSVVSSRLREAPGDAAYEIAEIDWQLHEAGAGESRLTLYEACAHALDLAAREWGEEYMESHTIALEASGDDVTITEGETPRVTLWQIEGI